VASGTKDQAVRRLSANSVQLVGGRISYRSTLSESVPLGPSLAPVYLASRGHHQRTAHRPTTLSRANRIQLGESNPNGRIESSWANRIQLGEIESSWQNLRGAIGLPRSRREATTHKVPRHLQRARRLPCRPRVRGARRGAADGGGRRGGGRRAGRVDHGAPRPARLREVVEPDAQRAAALEDAYAVYAARAGALFACGAI
jgi:hypothetical protein